MLLAAQFSRALEFGNHGVDGKAANGTGDVELAVGGVLHDVRNDLVALESEAGADHAQRVPKGSLQAYTLARFGCRDGTELRRAPVEQVAVTIDGGEISSLDRGNVDDFGYDITAGARGALCLMVLPAGVIST